MKALKAVLITILAASCIYAAEIKIGLILPLSGDNAALGQPQLNAVRLFENENAKGNFKHTYKIILEDDQLTPRLTAQAAQKLLNVDKVDGLVSLFCGAGNQLKPFVAQKKVPHINVICSDDNVPDGQWTFEHWPRIDKETSAFIDLLQKLNGKRIAILSMRQQGCLAVTQQAEKELKTRGIPYIVEYFNPEERDFRTQLAKISEFKPDILVPMAFTPTMEIILKRNKELGLNYYVTTFECFDFVADLSLAEGLYMVSGASATEEFNKRLIEASGVKAAYGVATIYDALNLLRISYEAQETPNHAAAAAYLSQIKDIPSALGKISVEIDGRIDSDIGFYQIKEGRPHPITFEEIER